MSKDAIVLLSGGLDSTTVAAMAKAEGYNLHALSFQYGQRHQAELLAAQKVAKMLDIRDHRIATIDLRLFGGSALTADIPVPKDREPAQDIPITYVPGRNTIFLSYALAFAEVTASEALFIGVNSMDYSGYPDCRPEYIAAFQKLADLATRHTVTGHKVAIKAPIQYMTKAEIVKTGLALGVDYSITLTCYDADAAGRSCGRCDACKLRLAGFAANGLKDPAPYRP